VNAPSFIIGHYSYKNVRMVIIIIILRRRNKTEKKIERTRGAGIAKG